ncbi:MAG TPA: hypothetical protein VJ767_03415 [Nitrososphaeraceae archaeon]|nr:hypothetical protein [Nitrososphaeraceae archaeon]
MARKIAGVPNSRLTRLINPSGGSRTMQLSEETFQTSKEHASHYYSSPSFDEVLVNLVKFYEQNDGRSHKYDS